MKKQNPGRKLKAHGPSGIHNKGEYTMPYTALSHCSLTCEPKDDWGTDLTSTAVRFLRDTCQDLRFSREKEQEEAATGILQGRSLRANQIPYNMEKDIDRLCLENAVRRFAASGAGKDAFDVYFCYLEMFVGAYDSSRRMIELLSEFESNGSSLLMKHRDHYSHSVYVFLLGLAIYETNEKYQRAYEDFYGFEDKGKAACHFLEFWGLAALFHDIGYPFELPYEQIASYFEVNKEKRKGKPFLAYHNLENYIKIEPKAKEKLAVLYKASDVEGTAKHGERSGPSFDTTEDLFAWEVADKLSSVYGITREGIKEALTARPVHPESCGNFMDHGYFSASILFKKLFEEMDGDITRAHVDALTAILLHNSLYKFDVACYKNKELNRPALRMELHPLAYLLMLCDELQCWDRISYGRNSRVELHPMDCRFTFLPDRIQAAYIYDVGEKAKVGRFEKEYAAWKEREPNRENAKEYQEWKAKKPGLKAYAGMVFENDFLENIKAIVDLTEMDLEVTVRLEKRDNRKKKTYLSSSSFVNLYNFAVALNGRWQKIGEWEQAKKQDAEEEFLRDNMEGFLKAFQELSLEYKLSNINQAKAFAGYLDEIDCFYTDKPVDYEILEHFEPEHAVKIGLMEHRRWLEEHIRMGWSFGEKLSKDERERRRIHEDMIPADQTLDGEISDEAVKKNYDRLGKGEQDKDIAPMDAMLTLLKLFEGLRIYKL